MPLSSKTVHLVAIVRFLPDWSAQVVVWSVGGDALCPHFVGVRSPRSSSGLQGRYQGMSRRAVMGAVAAGPLGGAVFAWSRPGMWRICALIGIGAAAVFLLTSDQSRTGPSENRSGSGV
jgi:hypothetical protein